MQDGKKANRNHSGERIVRLKSLLEVEFLRPNPDSIRLSEIKKDLHQAYKDEERFWRQKSRISLLKEGDRNTTYFQGCTKTCKARNHIISLKDDEGVEQHGEENIAQTVADYFSKLFSNNQPSESTSLTIYTVS